MNPRRWIVTALTGTVIAAGGFAAASAAQTVPDPGPAWGCVTGTSRTLEHVYTVQANFQNFLNSNGGSCPGGFPVAIGGSGAAPSPSPSPSMTSASPSPSPTATATAAPDCELVSLDRSDCGPYSDPDVKGGSNDGGATVRQEVWNPQPALRKQDLKVWSPENWNVTINAAAGNTEVNSYPDVSDTVTRSDGSPNPVSSYGSLVSAYAENMHATSGTDAEAAYDIWLNNYGKELMIWVDNHGQRPAGSDTGQNLTVAGNTYRIWDTSGHDTVSAVLDHNAMSGTTDILGIIRALTALGYYSAPGLNQVDFGFEAPSTGGADETFDVTGYTLKYS